MSKFISNRVDYSMILDIRINAEKRMVIGGQERWGQAIFNAAFSVAPERANELRGTIYDPFYFDDRIEIFLMKLQE